LISIANSLNFSVNDKINLVIINILINSPNGDTCILYNNLVKLLLKDNYLKDDIELSIHYLLSKEMIVQYKDYIYESKIFEYEKNIGLFLCNNNEEPFLSNFLDDAIDFLDNYDDYKLNNEQYNSFLNIFKFNVNITVGPAGSGKSEILIRLAKFIDQFSNISILFLTPTGKACDRLTKGFKNKDLNHKAFTIHKFNYYNQESNIEQFIIGEFNNIIKNTYKIFVIDEMSMIGLQDFNTFINRISNLNNCILFILGDTNQLPSISYGDILNHLVISNVFSVVKLQYIYRTNSQNLLRAQENVLLYKKLSDNFIESDNSFNWIRKYPLNNDFFINFLSNEFKDEMPFIITSSNKIIDMYQDKIKEIYNPNYLELESVIVNNIYFHINDIIMIKKNNYETHLMNGMIGKIISIEKPIMKLKNKCDFEKYKTLTMVTILFEGENKSRTLSLDNLDDISLAYLITIHKSQGSEYDNVVILLDNAPMNTINLLYTAITRTKKRCFLIADEYTINSIIENKRFTKRLSCLQDFCKNTL
jgi:exodeoxyribonuclease V alpha subunit